MSVVAHRLIQEAPRDRAYWEAYLGARRGTYAFRCHRYRTVWESLRRLGIADGDLIYDVGAGMCEFGRFLYSGANWTGRYVAVDGAIDGTDLDEWSPPDHGHALVAIEVVEHLRYPWQFMETLMNSALKGVVITTPNPEVVDVLAIDHTHRHGIYEAMLVDAGWEVEKHQLFKKKNDTLVATWRAQEGE